MTQEFERIDDTEFEEAHTQTASTKRRGRPRKADSQPQPQTAPPPVVAAEPQQPEKRKCPEDVEIENSPKGTYEFTNVLSPGVPLDCTIGSYHYHIEDGQKIELPECVAKRINTAKMPKRVYVEGAGPGQTIRKDGFQRRFTCVPA